MVMILSRLACGGVRQRLGGSRFLLRGESKTERMFIVRNGAVAWEYTHPGKGEISDAVLLPNGNVLFAHQYAITEINRRQESGVEL